MRAAELNRKEIDAMPTDLRALLEAELAAGNEVTEVGHAFPAPPAGAYFRLTKPLLTRASLPGRGLDYHDRNGSLYSGEVTDANRFYFLLEPPRDVAPTPDMEAIRAARTPKPEGTDEVGSTHRVVQAADVSSAASVRDEAGLTPVQRFKRSMAGNFEQWHDGIGYDLEALRAMSPAERESAEAMLIGRGVRDWRDVEALACFPSPAARKALRTALNQGNPEVCLAIMRHAPELVPDSNRIAFLVEALQTTLFFGGMGQTLDQVADFHPAPIVEVLLRGALEQSGDVAVHFAAMLCFIHGQASEPFDLAQRRFFLRFNTGNRVERQTLFRELCKMIGVEANRYLPASITSEN
jgi:hypothetical protein